MKKVENLLLPVFQNIIRENMGEKVQKIYDEEPVSIENFSIFYISKPELDEEKRDFQERNTINFPHTWEDIYNIDDEFYVHVERNSALEQRIVICFYVLNRAEEVVDIIKEKYMNFIRSSIDIGFDPISVLDEKFEDVEIEWCDYDNLEITAKHTSTKMNI